MGRGRKSRRNQWKAGTEATSIKEQPTVFPTAIYVRLSVENLGREDRGAIENQKDVCREFVNECPDLQLVRIYEDNGWTGTVMHRPAFDELMEDIKNGIIKAVVVRDLSRFARNYIEAGTYLEKIFPYLGVRFISVKERLDTLAVGDATESLIVPLQNLINDMYSKDLSRKIEASRAMQIKDGTLKWSSVPYGYRRSKEGVSIIPDEQRADFVRRIFQWKADGLTYNEIIQRLNASGAPKADVSFSRGKPWCIQAIRVILRNPAYIGLRILGKSHSAIYKGIKKEMTTPDCWHIFPEAHEALVSREVFDKVQALMDKEAKKRHDSMTKTAKDRAKLHDLFDGKIFCADCGKRMFYYRHRRPQIENSWYGSYVCSSYQNRYVEHKCTSHYISQKKLEPKVLAVLQTHIQVALDYEKLIASFQGSEQDRKKRHSFDVAIRRASQKLGAVQRKRTRLYEDYVEGVLDGEEYLFAKQSYEGESEKWNRELERLVAERNAYQEAMSPRNLWVNAMRSVGKLKTLTQKVVDATVERLHIYEDGSIHIVMKYQDIFDFTKDCLEGRKGNA